LLHFESMGISMVPIKWTLIEHEKNLVKQIKGKNKTVLKFDLQIMWHMAIYVNINVYVI
jgi:hypothetical protein